MAADVSSDEKPILNIEFEYFALVLLYAIIYLNGYFGRISLSLYACDLKLLESALKDGSLLERYLLIFYAYKCSTRTPKILNGADIVFVFNKSVFTWYGLITKRQVAVCLSQDHCLILFDNELFYGGTPLCKWLCFFNFKNKLGLRFFLLTPFHFEILVAFIKGTIRNILLIIELRCFIV